MTMSEKPLVVNVPPLRVSEEEAPRALLAPSLRVPALTVVVPAVRPSVPDMMRVPVPFLTMLPVPERVPENVVEVLSPPAPRLPEPSVMAPAPAIEATVSELLFRLRVAPLATVTAEVLGIRLEAPSWSVPALTLVAPV